MTSSSQQTSPTAIAACLLLHALSKLLVIIATTRYVDLLHSRKAESMIQICLPQYYTLLHLCTIKQYPNICQVFLTPPFPNLSDKLSSSEYPVNVLGLGEIC